VVWRFPDDTAATSKLSRARSRALRQASTSWRGVAFAYVFGFFVAQGCTKSATSAGNLTQPRVQRLAKVSLARTSEAIEVHSQVPVINTEPADTNATRGTPDCKSINDEPDMLPVAGGTFKMGSDAGGEEDEHPAHSVTVEGFWLDIDEVTVRDYQQCIAAGVCRAYRDQFGLPGSRFDETRFRQPNQPVSGISWDDANTYCEFRGKRLPREAEWERAARGDDGRVYPWGDIVPDSAVHGCFARALGTANGTTCAVGSYPRGAGPYGHHDLSGNVWEWMADFYDPFAYRRSGAAHGEPGTCQEIEETQNWLRAHNRQGFTGTNPIPTTCERVLRGGAFNYPVNGLRATNRVHHPGDWRLLMAGVRCAKDDPRDNDKSASTGTRCEHSSPTGSHGATTK
jgi:formylglycine-generating enzyme required for sulfatase activity